MGRQLCARSENSAQVCRLWVWHKIRMLYSVIVSLETLHQPNCFLELFQLSDGLMEFLHFESLTWICVQYAVLYVSDVYKAVFAMLQSIQLEKHTPWLKIQHWLIYCLTNRTVSLQHLTLISWLPSLLKSITCSYPIQTGIIFFSPSTACMYAFLVCTTQTVFYNALWNINSMLKACVIGVAFFRNFYYCYCDQHCGNQMSCHFSCIFCDG